MTQCHELSDKGSKKKTLNNGNYNHRKKLRDFRLNRNWCEKKLLTALVEKKNQTKKIWWKQLLNRGFNLARSKSLEIQIRNSTEIHWFHFPIIYPFSAIVWKAKAKFECAHWNVYLIFLIWCVYRSNSIAINGALCWHSCVFVFLHRAFWARHRFNSFALHFIQLHTGLVIISRFQMRMNEFRSIEFDIIFSQFVSFSQTT